MDCVTDVLWNWTLFLLLLLPSDTGLCKSNANEFRQISWLFVAFQRNFAWSNISRKFHWIFVTPTVLICAIFRLIIRLARWFTVNFRVITRSSCKGAVIFWTIICSSQKFDLMFINRPRALLKHSLLTEIYKWPFQLLDTKEAINLAEIASQLDERLAMKLTWLFHKER